MVGFLFPALQVSTWEPGCRSVDLFPPGWNGGFHLWRYSGVPWSTASSGGFSPMQAPGCRLAWSPRLLFLELLPPSRSGCGSFHGPSCSFHPAPAWFSSETSASWVLTVASAPDSERTFAFGRSICSVSGSTPSSLVASWCGGLGACLPFFPFPFPFGVCHSVRVNGQGAGGVLPVGLFPLSALGLPCLRSGGGRRGRQCLAGPSVLWDGCLVPVQVSSLPLLRYPVSLLRFRCAGLRLRPCGKCLYLCLRKVPWNRPRSWCWLSIHLSSLWKGRLMGQHLVIVSSPLGGCVHSLRFG